MTDESKAGAAALEAAKALRDTFEKAAAALAALGPDTEAQEPAPDPTPASPSLSEATDEAKRARGKYDSLIKWALGIFAGIAAIIFGSVPFANLTHVNPWPLAAGLTLAAIGLSLVVWGATRSWEPVDASLGELAASIDGAPDDTNAVLHPRTAANSRMKKIVAGEPHTHLGPGVESIAELIKKIGDLEADLLAAGGTTAQVSGVGFGTVHNPGSQAAISSAQLESVLAARESEIGSAEVLAQIAAVLNHAPSGRSRFEWSEVESKLSARLAVTKDILDQLGPQGDDSREPLSAEMKAALEHELGVVGDLIVALPNAAEIVSVGRTRALQDSLDLYLGRRRLLLSEATVAQSRAIFLVARRWIGLGAVLTLLGGVFYTFAIANPDDALNANTVVTVRVDSAAAGWTTLGKCLALTDDVESVSDLNGVLTKTDNRDGRQDGPFTVLITEGDCAQELIEVDEGNGFYTVVDPRGAGADDGGDSADASDGGGTASNEPKVLAALTARTPGWQQALAACSEIPLSGDVTDLRAFLVSPDTDANKDARANGPFTLRLTDDRCQVGATVTVDEGDGSYVPAS